MMLVFVEHCHILMPEILAFHMPLFFFMSGYCFKEKYLSPPPPIIFINKRIWGLYMPYIKWSLLFLLLHNIFYYLNIYNDEYGFRGEVSYLYTLREYAKRCVQIVIGLHGHEQLLGGYWFIPQLLYASVIGFYTIKYIKNVYVGLALTLGITIVASAFNFKFPFWNIKSLTFLSTVFFLMGYVYRKK